MIFNNDFFYGRQFPFFIKEYEALFFSRIFRIILYLSIKAQVSRISNDRPLRNTVSRDLYIETFTLLYTISWMWLGRLPLPENHGYDVDNPGNIKHGESGIRTHDHFILPRLRDVTLHRRLKRIGHLSSCTWKELQKSGNPATWSEVQRFPFTYLVLHPTLNSSQQISSILNKNATKTLCNKRNADVKDTAQPAQSIEDVLMNMRVTEVA